MKEIRGNRIYDFCLGVCFYVFFIGVASPSLLQADLDTGHPHFAVTPVIQRGHSLLIYLTNSRTAQEFNIIVMQMDGREVQNVRWNLGAGEARLLHFSNSGSQSMEYLVGVKMNRDISGVTWFMMTQDSSNNITSMADQRVFLGESQSGHEEEVGQQASLAINYVKAFPNPFSVNQGVQFACATTGASRLTIHIWTPGGRLIKTVEVNNPTNAIVNWDGKDEAGNSVSTGVFLVEAIVEGEKDKVVKRFPLGAVGGGQ